ncbi:unnamed protein product, partial [Ectocarpus sp. 12 AP-2014]
PKYLLAAAASRYVLPFERPTSAPTSTLLVRFQTLTLTPCCCSLISQQIFHLPLLTKLRFQLLCLCNLLHFFSSRIVTLAWTEHPAVQPLCGRDRPSSRAAGR